MPDAAAHQSPLWARAPRARIEQQAALVASLDPGTDEYQRAAGVLVVLKDSFQAMSEAKGIIEGIRLQRRLERKRGLESPTPD